ncbi:nicotinate phosphoribosyltransferase [Oenococcus sicerae]|uniref:Nicotinate phosphoribosyltransferase n=1 Tax=Oenococcus sicerae TaxID=2203724 RepID=A0ABX5QNE6_9LACO|nr:nicotinate phosphoribosyltransferase [Oenococcus sicerae]QAS70303.1 nicotinate phosphoribosyltransferase [Oenococcus sicerae]VDK14951.1 Nicotinate phosphoribosyltransferase pncB2 [Oenococcus sicerae]
MNLSMITDLYELSMANGYQQVLPKEVGVFDIFFRRVPDNGSFVVTAGLAQAIEVISDFHFSQEDLAYLQSLKLFTDDFLTFLENFHFSGDLSAIPEGTPVFPREPLLTISGPLIQTQLFETILLNIINHQSLIATKARRICYAAQGRPIMEFGARRAQGPSAATLGARAAVIGGCASTSNLLTAEKFGIASAGTMAHSWIEAFPDELTAFEKWAELYPDNSALLVDTYDVINSGVPNAIKVFKELVAKGHQPVGIRIDSGDISHLAKLARKQLDDAGFPNAKITASNALNEATIQSLLLNQKAPIDNFGVGEDLITSASDPVLSGVYKLVAVKHLGQTVAKIKISDSREKVTLPGIKSLYRLYNKNSHQAFADVIALKNEQLTTEMLVRSADPLDTKQKITLSNFDSMPLQTDIFINGKVVYTSPSVMAIQKQSQAAVQELPEETLRLTNPNKYPVYITEKLARLQEKLLNKQAH